MPSFSGLTKKPYFTELVRQTIPPERIAKAIEEGLGALETKFFSHEGVVQDKREVVNWSERRQYAQLAAEYGGYHAPPDKGERDQGGPGVILILPHPPKPTPVIGAKVVDVPAEDGSPMLILPDAPKGKADA